MLELSAEAKIALEEKVKAARDDRTLVMQAITKHPAALAHASETFRGDRPFVLGAAAHMVRMTHHSLTTTDTERLRTMVAELLEHSTLAIAERTSLTEAVNQLIEHKLHITKDRPQFPLAGKSSKIEPLIDAKPPAEQPTTTTTESEQEGKVLTAEEKALQDWWREGHGLR